MDCLDFRTGMRPPPTLLSHRHRLLASPPHCHLASPPHRPHRLLASPPHRLTASSPHCHLASPPHCYPSQLSDIQPYTELLGGNIPQAKWQVVGNQSFTEPRFCPVTGFVLTLCLRRRVATQTFRSLCCRHPGKEEICPGEKVISLQGGPGPIPGGVPGTPSMALNAFSCDVCGPGPGLQSVPGPLTDYRVELNKLPDWNGYE